MAIREAVLVCRGLRGVMEAAARSAKKAKGTTVGILPYYSKRDVNPYIDIAIVTGMSHARNMITAWTSDALIAIGGEYGTLSEIALGLKMGKPVIALKGGWKIKDKNSMSGLNSEREARGALK